MGSLNLDVTITVETLPAPGETVLGTSASRAGGGKGANQAAAARAAGASVAMVGAVGDDDAGRLMLEDLGGRGIDVDWVARVPGEYSGSATIAVDSAHGENLIIVDPGANGALTPADVRVDAVRDAAVVVAQLEVPVAAVQAAAEHATGRFILNPSPAVPLPGALLDRVDMLVLNQSELGVLAGVDTPRGSADAAVALRALGRAGPTLVTLGAAGALVDDGDVVHSLPALAVEPVDTTGAGDCFCGILAARLAAGDELLDAARLATAGAALATLAPGARGALPGIEEIRRAAEGLEPA
ncbi:MAG TPA: PfkB family carbohydrate kinase [Solirubrobacteraceae bacterium]|nr:PfkB family carbohydrate kinase [Solirubrobacteraceae bacterium]